MYKERKFIQILNREVNLTTVNSVFFNKEGREIVFSLNHPTTNNNGDCTSELIHLYLETEESFKSTGKTIYNELVQSKLFIVPCSDEPNRLDIINIDNISYIRYNDANLKITFNFKNSICKNGRWVSDFIHWKLSSDDTYLKEQASIQKYLI